MWYVKNCLRHRLQVFISAFTNYLTNSKRTLFLLLLFRQAVSGQCYKVLFHHKLRLKRHNLDNFVVSRSLESRITIVTRLAKTLARFLCQETYPWLAWLSTNYNQGVHLHNKKTLTKIEHNYRTKKVNITKTLPMLSSIRDCFRKFQIVLY